MPGMRFEWKGFSWENVWGLNGSVCIKQETKGLLIKGRKNNFDSKSVWFLYEGYLGIRRRVMVNWYTKGIIVGAYERKSNLRMNWKKMESFEFDP